MKTLIVNTCHYFGGGDSTYAFNLAELLRKNAHEVFFFAMKNERNFPDPNSALFVSNIGFRELNKRKNPITAIRVLSRSVYSVEARSKFSKLLDLVQPDIIHLQNIHAHITPSVIFEARKRKIPVVWTLHDYKLVCPNSHFLIDQTGEICEDCSTRGNFSAVRNRCKKGSFLASFMAYMEAEAHKKMHVRDQVNTYLCPSQFMVKKFLANGFDRDKVAHLPLFIPDDQFSFQSTDEGYLLFLGKLESIKGINQLFSAAKKVPQIKIKFAGSIDEFLKSQLCSIMPNNCEFMGLLHGEDLQKLKANARALVLPSICYENQPFSILEMFAMGKPVIASNIGGMKELIGNNERGWLVEPKDVEGLAKCMVEAVNEKKQYYAKAKAAFEYALKNHSEATHYLQLMTIYQKLLDF